MSTFVVLLLQLCSQEDDTAIELGIQLQGGLLRHKADKWKGVLSSKISCAQACNILRTPCKMCIRPQHARRMLEHWIDYRCGGMFWLETEREQGNQCK